MEDAAAPLLQQIRLAAETAAAETLASAVTEAEAIRAAARARAADRRSDALAAADHAAAVALARTGAVTSDRVSHDTLAARAAALERVFVAADRQFAPLASHPGLAGLLAATVGDGLSFLPTGTATVACSGAFAGATRAALEALHRGDVSVRVDDAVAAGVVIEAADGSMVVDATFARRLARERPRLSPVIARRLLEGPA